MLFLIPAYLSPQTDIAHFAPSIKDVIDKVDHFFVENEKTARRVIKFFHPEKKQSELKLYMLDKNTDLHSLKEPLELLKAGTDFGMLSEAGLPCIADPGGILVAWAHENRVKVVPLSGPSSIILALISSGFNGQSFTFHGYLPIDRQERRKKLLSLEQTLEKSGYSQIFMETPYRNMALMEDMQKSLKPLTKLCVASNIQDPDGEYIKTLPIKLWAKEKKDLHKIPTVFVLGR